MNRITIAITSPYIGPDICTGRKVEGILQNFLESMKRYNNLNSNYKKEKTLKLRSSLYLRLGSLYSDGK